MGNGQNKGKKKSAVSQYQKKIPYFEIPYRKSAQADYTMKTLTFYENLHQTLSLAVSNKTGKEVVVKKMLKFTENNVRFRSELYVAMNNKHKNVIELLDYFETETHNYLVYEYFKGVSVHEFFYENKETVTENDLINAIRQMIAGVAHLHENRFIHRNLDLDHFLFDGKTVKLINLHHALEIEKWPLKTKKGKGLVDIETTLYFQSPEMVQGSYNHKAEVWVVGALIHFLVIGKPPYIADTPKKLKEMILTYQITWDYLKKRKINKGIYEVLKNMLIHDSEQRADLSVILEYPVFKDKLPLKPLRIDEKNFKGYFIAMERFRFNQLLSLMVMEAKLEHDEGEHINTVFTDYDKNGDGILTRDEIWSLLERITVLMNKEDFEALFRRYDKKKEKQVQISEFVKAFAENRTNLRVQQIDHYFNRFDIEKKGYFHLQEFEEILDLRINDERVRSMFNKAAGDDNRLDREEFLKFLILMVELELGR